MVRGENDEDNSSPRIIEEDNSSNSSSDGGDDDNNDNDDNRQQQTAATTTSLKSSADAQDKTKKSAQSSPGWDGLPSVILLEIFSYLPHESRIQASQVCRHWRYALFHPSFWKKITFSLMDSDSVMWSRCLSSWFKFSVQEVTIRCDSAHHFVREAMFILKKLSGNRQLRKICLEPSSSIFEYPNQEVNSQKFLKQLLSIVETSNCLEAFSLGCIEELTEALSSILEPLKNNHASHLTHLSLASVKEDPDHYEFLELDCSLFNNFVRLSFLTIDYDHVSDELLLALNSGTMERLVIHVHGWNVDYLGASNESWIAFTEKNPRCDLRLSLIHSYNAVSVLDSEILQAAMPLTHLKVLFCESVNIMALHQISHWYSKTLQSIIWIDSINSQKSSCLLNPHYDYGIESPDPLVLAAWRCKNLSEIVFIGQKYLVDNLLAIIRLRRNVLKRLEFAENDIEFDDSWIDHEAIIDEVKEVMGKQWKLLSDQELPQVVMNPLSGDSREVIMPMVLRDQK